MHVQYDNPDSKVCDWCQKRTATTGWTIRNFEVKPRSTIPSEFLPSKLFFCSFCFPRVYNDASRYANEGISTNNRYRTIFIVLCLFIISFVFFLQNLLYSITVEGLLSELFFVFFFSLIVFLPISVIAALIPILGLKRAPFQIDSIIRKRILGSPFRKTIPAEEVNLSLYFHFLSGLCTLFVGVSFYGTLVISMLTRWGLTSKMQGSLIFPSISLYFSFPLILIGLFIYLKSKYDEKVIQESMMLAENDPNIEFLEIDLY